MKAVMISINPKWCGLIASGKKTVEVRKTKPKLPTPFKCYIYCTKGAPIYQPRDIFGNHALNGKVIGEFVCDKITEIKSDAVYSKVFGGFDVRFNFDKYASCLTEEQIFNYIGEGKGYAWHISELKIYDEPKPLYDFYKPGALSEYDLDDNLCNYCVDTEHGKYRMVGSPDGPLMCEGRFCGAAYQEYLDEEFQITRPPQSWCYVEEA